MENFFALDINNMVLGIDMMLTANWGKLPIAKTEMQGSAYVIQLTIEDRITTLTVRQGESLFDAMLVHKKGNGEETITTLRETLQNLNYGTY